MILKFIPKEIKNSVYIHLLTVPKRHSAIFANRDKIFKILIQRLIIIKVFMFYLLFLSHKIKKQTKNLRKLRRNYKDKRVLLIANGPSSQKISPINLGKLQKKGEVVIIGINYSPVIIVEKFRRSLHLDYLVLSDHATHPSNKTKMNSDLWKLIQQEKIKVISPSNWCDINIFRECEIGNCLHFNDFGTERLFRGTNPTRTRNYIPITAFKALAICRYLLFSEIYLIGLDNNFYNDIIVDDKLNLKWTIYYGTNITSEKDETEFWPLGMGDFFNFVSRIFLDLRDYFDDHRIINLDRKSSNDVHRKVTSADIGLQILLKRYR